VPEEVFHASRLHPRYSGLGRLLGIAHVDRTAIGRASSIHFTEAFRIENNLIRRVEMIGTSVPYHFISSWGPVLSGK
jgi:hypothetical protein